MTKSRKIRVSIDQYQVCCVRTHIFLGVNATFIVFFVTLQAKNIQYNDLAYKERQYEGQARQVGAAHIH